MDEKWWKKAVVYQIYVKSFMDASGDGIGDIQGIISKLDYLKTLGIDVIWLTPIYQSPQKDNGYDISDYYKIHEEYGGMEDFDKLLEEAHLRGIKVIMDLVVNHTSTEHPWFIQSRESRENPYRDYYIWRDPKEGKEPNNWLSKFGGTAWQYDEHTNQYYLHLYDVTQADLNWENTEVRQKVYEMMHFWLKKGVDGFRLDVINVISKDPFFPDDDPSKKPGDGRIFYTDGPRVHEYLQEMNREVLSKYDVMTVGEMSSTTIDHCIKYTSPERKELNMVFNFHHLKVDYPDGDKWKVGEFDFLALKRILSEWQIEMNKGNGWNALFWCNHDQPRVISRYGNDEMYLNESAKMLATAIHFMQGTPYIYQGEEIGMTNPKFNHIEEYRDVETLNVYRILKNEGLKDKEIIEIIKQKSRDNSRTPVHWNDSINAGFTIGTPWIYAAPNYKEINVKKALEDPNSIFYYYKHLIQLRKDLDIITTGNFEMILEDHPQIFAYIRSIENEKLLVVNNFFVENTIFELPASVNLQGFVSRILISNYQDASEDYQNVSLRPYETIVYHLKN